MENSKKSPKNRASAIRSARRALFLEVKSNSDTPKHPLQLQFNQWLSHHLPANPGQSRPRLLLALSGGLDSCVLLHLLVKAGHVLPFEWHVMHVHHGLSVNAEAWANFCLQQCQQVNVPLQIVHVNVTKTAKQGVEAEARQLRYNALFGYQFSNEVLADFIVTAHHQDDQAETLLLQLFRGAGVKGLSGMAAVDKTRRLLRPLLNVPRQALIDFAQQHTIQWCIDESNDNTQYERNFVRHEVMPILESRFQSVKSVLARTASHLAEADELLAVLARQDAENLLANNSLCLQGLSQLDLSRAKNMLRWWFSKNKLAMPSTEHLGEITQQLLHAKKDADLSIQLQALTLKRYQQRAYLYPDKIAEPFNLVWNGEAVLALPSGGQLHFHQVTGAGLALKFGITRLRITHREGGERFKPNALRPTRTLKYLLQEANMPPWQRTHLPLVYRDDTLACVPGIGVAHEWQTNENELGLQITWQDASC